MSKKRLGKGLGALIVENNEEPDSTEQVKDIYVEHIEPNPYQPRQEFDDEALEKLGDSILENGIIQPITVRKVEPELFQLVAGERRWRACRLKGVKKVPALINEYSDRQMMEIALIENLQREDLNPLEEAQAYRKMMEEFDMTQADVAKKVSKSRSSIANFVRLLNLPPRVQIHVSRGTISMGHARVLLALENNEAQVEAAEYIINKELSVRETEKYIKQLKSKENKKDRPKKKNIDPAWKKAAEEISSALEMKVKVRKKKKNNELAIECKSYEELQKILDLISNNY